jgi:hypothetical protein
MTAYLALSITNSAIIEAISTVKIGTSTLRTARHVCSVTKKEKNSTYQYSKRHMETFISFLQRLATTILKANKQKFS